MQAQLRQRPEPHARGSGLVRRAATVLPVLLALAVAGVVYQGNAKSAVDPHAGHRMTTTAAQTAAILAEQQLAPIRGSEFRADCSATHLGDNDRFAVVNRRRSRLKSGGSEHESAYASQHGSLRGGQDPGARDCASSVVRSGVHMPGIVDSGSRRPRPAASS